MSNTNVTFATSSITIPANSSKSYGNKGASPKNFYQASVTISESGNNGSISVENGWSMIDGDYWNGPTFLLVNKGDKDVTCNLQVVSIGPDTAPNMDFVAI